MDALLLLGNQDQQLTKFLGKVGYQLIVPEGDTPLTQVLKENIVDLIVIDSRIEQDGVELCEFLRSQELTKKVPIVYLSEQAVQLQAIKSKQFQRVELVQIPYSIGAISGKIATQLRLRKIAGSSSITATLSEVNASLRDHNQRMQKDVEEARQIQQSLLPPPLPQDARYQLAVSYEPLQEVGGDWYHLANDSEGRVCLHIADVTGHGLSAALMGSMTKLALVAAGQHPPHVQLAEVNRLLSPQLPQGRFVTMGSYRYDPRDGSLEYARAGHPPLLHLQRKEQKVMQLKGEGFAIGFFDMGEYSPGKVTMAPGDVFVAITDGISEAQDRGFKMYGFERLSEVLLRTSPDASAEHMLAAIRSDFTEFLDGRMLKDDVTVVVLKHL